MEKFRLILHGALDGSAQGKVDLIDRLESGLGLSRETAEILMSDLPRMIREDLTEAEASDLSFELETLGALVETVAYGVDDEASPTFDADEINLAELSEGDAPVNDLSASVLESVTAEITETEAKPLFDISDDEILADEVNSLLATADEPEPEAAPELPPEPSKPTPTLSQSVHNDLASLDLSSTTSEDSFEIGFDNESAPEQQQSRVVGFFDDPAPSPSEPVSPTHTPVAPTPAPAQPAHEQTEAFVDAFKVAAARPSQPTTSNVDINPPKSSNKFITFAIGGAILAVASLGGFFAFNQPESKPDVSVSGNIGALLKDQDKILDTENEIKIPKVKTLRSWTRDFVQEKYSGKIVVDELPEGKTRIRVSLSFLKPDRPTKEDIAMGRGRSEWITTADGDLESTPEVDGVNIHLPIKGSLRAYLQGISMTSRKPVDVSGSVAVDSKASLITAKLELKIRLKNLSPEVKTTQEPFSDYVSLLEIK